MPVAREPEVCRQQPHDGARELERLSLELYRFGAEHMKPRGLLLADTKFEFGLLDGKPWIGLPGNPVSTMVTLLASLVIEAAATIATARAFRP